MTGDAGARVRNHLFEDLDSLSGALAALIAAQLRAALEARPAAGLVVAGGRTPAAFLTRLSNEALAWDRVFVTLTDERWVGADDPASNAAMLRTTLLVGAAARARFIPLYTGAATPDAAVDEVSKGLAVVPRPFDIMVLGMGDDGHTASLFPGADNLGAALAPKNRQSCMAIRAPGAPQPRMTLTLPTLLDARSLFVLFTGPSKRRTYEMTRQDGPVEDMPIRGVLRGAPVPVDVFYTA
jgi:6-phosphogluconolactonase